MTWSGTARTAVLCTMFPAAAWAQDSKFGITAFEKAACGADAIRYCRHAYPDEDRLLDCMRSNRSNLTRFCLTVFSAGLKRRHIAM